MALADRKAEEHAKDIPEEALYSGGFPSNSDARKMATFRALPPEEMADAFDRLEFDREDLAELTLYFNNPLLSLQPDGFCLQRRGIGRFSGSIEKASGYHRYSG